MKPFSSLPTRVLASLLAVVAGLAVAALLWPAWVAAALAAGVALTLAGGAVVALEARARAGGAAEAPAGLRAPAFAFAVLVVGLVLASAPGPYFKDGAELAAAAHGLGVPHPTGFPAFCLAGKAFDLLPAGTAWWRIDLLSAVATALAGALALALAREAGVPLWAAALAPAAWVASHAVWLHGTTAEVYPLSAAGTAATLLAFLVAARRGDARAFVAGAFLAGLGLAGHVTWPLYGGIAGVVAAVALARRRALGAGTLAAAAGAALLGALAVLYLPVAARRDPVMDWGHPATLEGLWEHLSGERIRRSFAPTIGGAGSAVVAANVRQAVRAFWDGTGPVWPLAVLGLAGMARGAPAAAVTLAGVLAADLLFAIRVNPMGTPDLQTLVPATLVTAVLAAAGAAVLARVAARVLGDRGASAVGLGLGAVAIAAQALAAPADRDMTAVHAPREIASGLLRDAGTGAAVFATSDDLSATLLGLQAVEDARPDVRVLVRQHLGDRERVERILRWHAGVPGGEVLARESAERPFETAGESPAAALERALSAAAVAGPVFVEPGEDVVDRELWPRLSPAFPAWTWGPAAEYAGAPAAVRDALAAAPSSDRWGREFLAGFARVVGARLAAAGREAQGIEALTAALRLSPDDSRALYNLGVLIQDAGRPGDAAALFRHAVRVAPGYLRAWNALARALEAAGDAAGAAEARRRAEALEDR